MKNKWQMRVQNFTPMTHYNVMKVISKNTYKSRLNVPYSKICILLRQNYMNVHRTLDLHTAEKHNFPSCKGMEITTCLNQKQIMTFRTHTQTQTNTHAHTHTNIYIYIYTHTHTHTHNFWNNFKLLAPCVLNTGQAFRYSPENAFYILNQQIYFIIRYLLDRASLI